MKKPQTQKWEEGFGRGGRGGGGKEERELGPGGGGESKGKNQTRRRKTVSTATATAIVCLSPQQHASVSQGRICCTCCHTEIEVADPTFYCTLSQYTDTRPISHSADPITPGAWQGSHWSAN